MFKLSRVTDRTIVDREAFKADVLAGRKRGYYVVRGETVTDVMGISIAQRIGKRYMGSASPDRLDAWRSMRGFM